MGHAVDAGVLGEQEAATHPPADGARLYAGREELAPRYVARLSGREPLDGANGVCCA